MPGQVLQTFWKRVGYPAPAIFCHHVPACRPEDVHVPLDWHAENLALAIERTEESSRVSTCHLGRVKNPDDGQKIAHKELLQPNMVSDVLTHPQFSLSDT